jgi:hypothetical protein
MLLTKTVPVVTQYDPHTILSLTDRTSFSIPRSYERRQCLPGRVIGIALCCTGGLHSKHGDNWHFHIYFLTTRNGSIIMIDTKQKLILERGNTTTLLFCVLGSSLILRNSQPVKVRPWENRHYKFPKVRYDQR